MTSRPSIIRVGILLVAAVLASACIGGRSPSVKFYNLKATETAPGPATEAGPAIAVGPVVFPKSLRRSQIVIRTGPNSVELDEFHRWSGSLESDFLETLGADLGALLATDRVSVYPGEARFPVDYRLGLQVERFDGTPGGTLVLGVRWTLTPGEGTDATAAGYSVIEQPVPGDTVDDLVRAHDVAVGEFSREIAARIRSL